MTLTQERLQPAAPNGFPAEFRLMAACAAWPMSPARVAAIRSAAEAPIDWSRFERVVRRHRVAGLVHHGLRAAGITPPAATMAGLSERAREVARGELLLASEAVRLTKLLKTAGIQVAVLKGLAVALQAFGKIGLRFNHDIDLLVRPSDVASSAALLEQAGYVRFEPHAAATPREVKTWLRQRKDMAFRHSESRAIVELHWRLFNNRHFLPGIENGERRVVQVSANTAIDTMHGDVTMLYLMSHGALHAWSRLKWLADVGALLSQRSPEEISALYAHAKSKNVSQVVAPGLKLSAVLFDTHLPNEVADDMVRRQRLTWLYETFRRCLVGDGDGTELEDEKFGTTRKNISHYLMANGVRYWAAEAYFDLTDDTSLPVTGNWRMLGPLARPVLWLTRKFSS